MTLLRHIAEAHQAALDVSLEDFLSERCAPGVLNCLDSLVRELRAAGRYNFGALLVREIADRLPLTGGDPWRRIKDYCRRRLDNELLDAGFLVEVIIRIFRPEGPEAWIDSEVIHHREPMLEYDDHNLLIGPANKITFTKEGVLSPSHYLLYASQVPGSMQSNGFVDELLKVRSQAKVSKFGIAVNMEALLGRSYHRDCFTKAYIRGPRGLTKNSLNNPRFPEEATGSVTMHKRVEDIPIYKLFPLDRLEVMWSFRDGIKTIQIEELLPINPQPFLQGLIFNRYVHARWDPKSSIFIHLDGAIRGYEFEQYPERLATDLKKYSGRAAQYSKAFRLDGEISLNDWCRLVAKFFQNNELILEYLGGPEPNQ